MADAIAAGADAFFDEKYGETVRTVRVEGYSLELCGGTHCTASGQIGSFVITADRSIGAGTRRVEADDRRRRRRLLRERLALLDRNLRDAVGADTPSRPRRIEWRPCRMSCARRAPSQGRRNRPAQGERSRRGARKSVPGVKLVAHSAAFESPEQWKGYVKEIRAALGSGVIALASTRTRRRSS
jgi:alanyl-tRNA synthetase